MDNTKYKSASPKSKSLFDIIEERSDSPEPFVWSKEMPAGSDTGSEVLFEGTLLSLSRLGTSYVARRYILTLQTLTVCKVSQLSL